MGASDAARDGFTGVGVSTPGITAAGATRSATPVDPNAPFGVNPITGVPFTPVATSDAQLAADLNTYIAAKYPSSPLRGMGGIFVQAGRSNGIDPDLLVALAQEESGLGTQAPAGSNNAFGLGPGLHFATWQAGIQHAAATIAGYHAPDIAGVVSKWNPKSSINPQGPAAEIAAVTSILAGLPNQGIAPPTSSGTNVSPSGAVISHGIVPDTIRKFSSITDALGAIANAFGWLTDPHNWLRLGEILGGAGAVGLGIWSLIRGHAALGLGLGMLGYLLAYAGVRDVSPIREIQDAFRPGAASSSMSGKP